MATGEGICEVHDTVLPNDVAREFVRQAGLQGRQRELEVESVRFIRATVISASSGRGGPQADILRLYFEDAPGSCAARRIGLKFAPLIHATMQLPPVEIVDPARVGSVYTSMAAMRS